MRVVIDTNVFLGYLLSRAPETTAAGAILRAAFAGRLTLLLLDSVTVELSRKVNEVARLARQVPNSDVAELVADLSQVAEIVPILPKPYPQVGRDRDDDFVIAHSVLARADFLVTWDKDLLDLIELDGIRVVTPPTFLAALRAAVASDEI